MAGAKKSIKKVVDPVETLLAGLAKAGPKGVSVAAARKKAPDAVETLLQSAAAVIRGSGKSEKVYLTAHAPPSEEEQRAAVRARVAELLAATGGAPLPVAAAKKQLEKALLPHLSEVIDERVSAGEWFWSGSGKAKGLVDRRPPSPAELAATALRGLLLPNPQSAAKLKLPKALAPHLGPALARLVANGQAHVREVQGERWVASEPIRVSWLIATRAGKAVSQIVAAAKELGFGDLTQDRLLRLIDDAALPLELTEGELRTWHRDSSAQRRLRTASLGDVARRWCEQRGVPAEGKPLAAFRARIEALVASKVIYVEPEKAPADMDTVERAVAFEMLPGQHAFAFGFLQEK